MKRVIFHSGAKLDLSSAAAYYESQRKGLGREFRLEIEEAVSRIRENPQLFSLHTEFGTRKCSVSRFPYTVIFAEQADTIWIVAVAHHRRRPGYWTSRRPG